ncbi:PREDICTED: vomeronasal type-1 receptor 3-like [Cercocebus atys]|uniref:vomeronasal type-1 receptor 3-like n=1 Tax=Cercocebus atys TaxID=9531 RepID=UPI0005F43689|nr:PREDICTED: vomeronasal type-1 receptor 3-like [Cercocebus atys]
MVSEQYRILVDILSVAHASLTFPCGSSGLDDKYQSVGTDRMAAKDLAIGRIFLSQAVLRILGNFCFLYRYLFLYFTGLRLRSTELIIKHLTVVNSLFLTLSKSLADNRSFGVETFPECFMFGNHASGSMVFILYRHEQQVQYIHRTNIPPRFFPESRAIKILLLVSTFFLKKNHFIPPSSPFV